MKTLNQEPTIEKLEKDVYWVQSFTKKQLYYKVVLQAEKDKVSCQCDAFRFNPEFVCKHINHVVKNEVRING